MPEVKPPIETIAKIKVIGVGGSGGSAVNRMIASKVQGVEFIAVNTDLQALQVSCAGNKLHIGKATTRGLGAGMNPDLGRKAAEESQNEIREMLKGSDMVFITCGLGGGTGSGAAPVIAELAKELGALTIAVVTKPFAFEGGPRKKIADEALRQIENKVDTLIVIPNDKIWQIIDKKTPIVEAFAMVDEVLRQGVQGISELITLPGLINVDFADVKTIMFNAGSALMGVGEATGDNRAIEAAKAAISSPLLETSIEGAKGVLFTVISGSNLSMHEVNDVAKIITEKVDSDARIIFGAVVDEKIKDTLKVTVVATGFEKKDNLMRLPQASSVTYFGQQVKKTESKPSHLFTAGSTPNFDNKEEASTLTREKTKESAREKVKETDDDNDDFEIPAFIRKKMM
ncbi:MAG: cell division protein FtsZ [Candidatus Falkowbacteria bacterium]